jgi:hypothetical protein
MYALLLYAIVRFFVRACERVAHSGQRPGEPAADILRNVLPGHEPQLLGSSPGGENGPVTKLGERTLAGSARSRFIKVSAHCFAKWSTRRCCWLCTSTSPRSSKRVFASSNDRQCSLIERNSDAIQDPSLLGARDFSLGDLGAGSLSELQPQPEHRQLTHLCLLTQHQRSPRFHSGASTTCGLADEVELAVQTAYNELESTESSRVLQQELVHGAALSSQAQLAVAQEFDVKTLLLQSQLGYTQAHDELVHALGQTPK